MKKKTGLLVILSVAVFLAFWLRRMTEKEYRYYDGSHLSSVHSLRIASTVGKEKADALWQDILNLLDKAEKSFSFTFPDSEINRFNALSAGEEMEVSTLFSQVYLTAEKYYLQTGGVFDPSVYPYLKLWGFTDGNYRLPSEKEILSLRPLVGLDKLLYREEDGRFYLSKTQGDVVLNGETYRQSLDFGAVVKGYLCDEVKELFVKYGITQGSFQCGISSLLVVGEQTVRLKDPRGEAVIAELTVKDAFLSDSGDRYRYFERDGVRYSHLIDPFTGKPASSDVQSAAVLSQSGAGSDVYSTVAVLRGETLENTLTVKEGTITVRGIVLRLRDKNYQLIEE